MTPVTDHRGPGLNDALLINALDDPGPGGARHVYAIFADERVVSTPPGVTVYTTISFQKGPVNEAGVNGITQEALLAVVIDRLRAFQAGQYGCRENAVALTKCEEAMMWLQKRTRDRIARGVEGTSVR
jgi:hypothetical protein